jgi:hypothetical protein
VTPCGETIPDFSAAPAINETYNVSFANSVFSRTPPLPSVASTGTLTGSSPGASIALARSAWLFGASMADPINGAWPSRTALTQLDSDADGKVGLTATYQNVGGYSAVPANSLGTSRATRGYLAGRSVFTLSGTLTSCTMASGSATVQDIDSHTLGCRLTSGSDCSSTESSYLDSNGPNYQTGTASFTAIKVSDAAGCAEVRTALP